MKPRQLLQTLLGLSFALVVVTRPAEARPDQPFAATPDEMAMCQVMVWGGHDTSDKANWMHMHHYCDCLRLRNRALRYPPGHPQFKFNLQVGVGGCQYVIDHTSPTFYMLPYVYVDKGRGLMLLGDKGQAVAAFEKAMSLNPDFAPAYVELANFYEGAGQKKKALETVSEGLRHDPENKTLKRIYLRVGGKEPFPEPIAKPEPPASPAAEAATEAKPEPEAPTAAFDPSAESAEPAKPAPEQPQDSSPKSPYCRFCPD